MEYDDHLVIPGVPFDTNLDNEFEEDKEFPNHIPIRMNDETLMELDSLAKAENIRRDFVIAELIHERAESQ